METYNFGQNKMEQQTPIPPKSRMKPRKSQNAPFSHPWFRGGKRGECKFPVYFVQDYSRALFANTSVLFYLTLYLAVCLKKLLPSRLLPSNSFFRPKTLQSSHYKPKSATIAFFLFSSFRPPSSFFFSFPFLSILWFSRFLAQEACLLTLFHSHHCKFRWVRFQKID